MEPLEAIEYSSIACHICPNRLWAIGSRFDDWETQLPRLVQNYGAYIGRTLDEEEHLACTVDFCERSALDFTNVDQRHEPSHCAKPCYRLRGLFDDKLLVQELSHDKGPRPTPWALTGLSILSPAQPFMAISHVWSDGTGRGTWPSGEVNVCLFQYFERIALSLQCEGIWWDAVCMPSSKAARSTAINNMDINYQHAKVTLVHDCFLRRLPWIDDPNAACFAIILSPWFSRGWTALELTKSRTVKVVFAGDTVVDLDADILDRVEAGNPAAQTIRALRKPIEQLDDLLNVLGSRHTSRPKDLAIIAGLLSGVVASSASSSTTGFQRDIHQAILRKIGKLSHGHLFHKHATMSGSFGWCPTSIFQLPRAREDLRSVLRVTEQGELRGAWKVVHLDAIPVDAYFWGLSHPLVEKAMQSALRKKGMHVLLAEPSAESVGRGILVKVWKDRSGPRPKSQYLGSLSFHPRISIENAPELDIIIGDVKGLQPLHDGDDAWDMLQNQDKPDSLASASIPGGISTIPVPATNNTVDSIATEPGPPHPRQSLEAKEIPIRAVRPMSEQSRMSDGRPTAMSVARNRIAELKASNSSISLKDSYGRTLLHWAAEAGDMQVFQLVLHTFRAEGASLDAKNRHGRNVLHLAIRRGHRSIARVLLNLQLDLDMIRAQDIWGQTALHLAVSRGDPVVIRWLADELESTTLMLEDGLGCTALALAARCLHGDAVTAVLQRYTTEGISGRDRSGKTILHLAARGGNVEAVRFLIDRWSEESIVSRSASGETALHLAVRSGSIEVVSMLMSRWSHEHIAATSESGETALHVAVHSTNTAVLKFLAECWPQEYVAIRTTGGTTALDLAGLRGNTEAAKVLIARWLREFIAADVGPNRPALLSEMTRHCPEVLTLLLESWPRDCSPPDTSSCKTAFWEASSSRRIDLARALEILMGWLPQESIVWAASDGETALHRAARTGNSNAIKLLLDRWPPKLIAGATENGENTLHIAADAGAEEVVQLLIQRWPQKHLTAKASDGETALHRAIRSGKPGVVRVMLGYWPPKLVAAKTDDGATVFSLAEWSGSEEMMKLLDDNIPRLPRSIGALLNNTLSRHSRSIGTVKGSHLLQAEVEKTATERIIAERLCLEESLPSSQGLVGWLKAAPFHRAAAAGNTAEVQDLMTVLPEDIITAKTRSGETALHLAARSGHLQTVEALCRRWPGEHAAAIIERNGFTALHVAVENENVEIAKILMDHHPQITTVRTEDCRTALHLAAARGHVAMVRLLLERFSAEDLQATDMGRETALHMAAQSGSEGAVQLLLQRLPPAQIGADSTHVPHFRAISSAVHCGNEAMVQMLVNRYPQKQLGDLHHEISLLVSDKSDLPGPPSRGKIECILRLL